MTSAASTAVAPRIPTCDFIRVMLSSPLKDARSSVSDVFPMKEVAMILAHSRVLWSATLLPVGLTLPIRAGAGAAPAASVCDLVTREEAGAALGAAVSA